MAELKTRHDIAILIPCYNAEKYIPRLVETIKAQSVPFTEVLLFDDNSSDNSASVAKELGLEVIQSKEAKNQGPSYARNRLLEKTQCTWIHFHDADDLLDPTFVEKCSHVINSDVDIITTNCDWIDQRYDSLQIKRRYSQEAFNKHSLNETIINPIGVVSTLLRRESLLQVEGFDETLHCWEDGDLYVRLAAEGARFTVIPEVLAYSMRHMEGISVDKVLCAESRQRLLSNYRDQFHEKISNEVFISEYEKVASQFVSLRRWKECRETIKKMEALGAEIPRTKNPLLSLMKPLLPSHWLYILQQLFHSTR